MKSKLRIYIDTSVFGGLYDAEFADASKVFFERVGCVDFQPVVSALVMTELVCAPAEVRNYFEKFVSCADMVDVNDDTIRLMHSYIDAGVVSAKWRDDALHVAAASVSRCAIIASWNFKHIVNYRKVPRYNAVNILNGYGPIAIHSPLELMSDEE